MRFTFNPFYPEATNEHKWEQIRLWRRQKLSETDWTQLPDSPVNKQLWAEYRQALRDLPSKYDKADDVILPELPNAETV